MAAPHDLDVTLEQRNPADPSDATWHPATPVLRAVRDHFIAPDLIWVTSPWRPQAQPNVTPRWTYLDSPLRDYRARRCQLRLPRPAPDARGRLILDDLHLTLICIDHDVRPGSLYDTFGRYPQADPLWVADLPTHSRLLLHAIYMCPKKPNRRGSRLCSHTTDQLQNLLEPLLALPALVQETLARVVTNASSPDSDTPPSVAELHQIAAALT